MTDDRGDQRSDAGPLPRKLAAILYADMVGYSALAHNDEEGTHQQLRTSLDAIEELVKAHEGVVVNYAGDAVLADFQTASAALECALDIQKKHPSDAAENQRGPGIQYRIGINLGEVILDRNDLYGDGVNVAARIQGLAEPGGICVSQSVVAAIGNKLSFDAVDLGLQKVKNINDPIHVYRIVTETSANTSNRSRSKRFVVAVMVLGIVAAIAVYGWGQLMALPDVDLEKFTAAQIAEFPAVAVLPFRNLSDDKDQEYFSDGVTNDIINDLSRFSRLSVIASNTVFTYKDNAVKVDQVGKELGVTFVLEGSIQKVGDQIRINAQLIDVATGAHKWADRFDAKMTNIFSVQDEITQSIVSAMQVVLTTDEQERTARALTSNIEAYDLFLRGRSYLRGSRTTHAKARELFDAAIDLDPEFAAAYAEKSLTYFSGFIMPMSRNPDIVRKSLASAERAVELDPTLPLAQARLGWALFANRRHDEALVAAKRAVKYGPNSAEAHVQLGNILNWSGQPEAGIYQIETAMRLNPQYPFYYLFYLGHSHYLLGNNDEAIKLMKRVVTRAPKFLPVRRHLAVLYVEAGLQQEAAAQSREVVRIFPGASVQDELARCFYRWTPKLRDRFINGLRKSGMPEGVAGEEPMEM
ncbi:MAG: adenylate/guanylate cyclase domain-containing protein [Rhizobiaceae bacterium]